MEKGNKVNESKKVKPIDVIAIILIVVIFIVVAPLTFINNGEDEKTNIYTVEKSSDEYPLEVKITETEKNILAQFFNQYAIGITGKNVDFLDGISYEEMTEFAIAILSKESSADSTIRKEDVDKTIERYFDADSIDYNSLGYEQFNVNSDFNQKKVFNVTKLIHLKKEASIYIAYADCLDISKVHEGTYKKEDVEGEYIFTLKRIIAENKIENIVHKEVRYVLEKVEKI